MADLAVIASVLAATALGVAFINFCSSLAKVDFEPHPRGSEDITPQGSSPRVPEAKGRR